MKWVETQMAELDRWMALAMSGNFEAINAEITRMVLFSAAIWALGWILFFGLLYLVIRAAVRDGINESRMGGKWWQAPPKPDNTPRLDADTVPGDLPPMKAEK